MLFRKIMTEVNEDDGSEEEFIAIARVEEKPYNDDTYRVRYEAVTFDQVTTEQLISAIEGELESENHFSRMDQPRKIVDHITAVAGADVAKQVLFNMFDSSFFS